MLQKWSLFLLLTLTGVCFSQQQQQQQGENKEEYVTVSVPKSSLTPQQQLNLKQQEVHGWVGIGKEVGEAVNGSLEAITHNANDFAHTGVGKVTMALVIWKVLGDQAVHIIAGFLILVIGLPLWIWSYRRTCLPRRILIENTILPDKTHTKKWQIVNDRDPDNRSKNELHDVFLVVHYLGLAVYIIILLITVFSY